jgi:hypothetical protein
VVFKQKLEAIAAIVLRVLLILHQSILVVVYAGVDVGSGLFFVKSLHW